MSNQVLILLDADVLIHLSAAEKISILNTLFPKRLRMLDIVCNELRNNQTMRDKINSIFLFSGIIEIPMPTTSNPALFSEYLKLKSKIDGDGERATLVYCKHNKHIIASSNTKDIVPFSTEHSIAYLTTLDIFAIAIHKGIMTKKEVNDCIKLIKKEGSYLKAKNIDDYLEKEFDKIKYSY